MELASTDEKRGWLGVAARFVRATREK